METHIAKIIGITQVTHDVKSFRLEKPAGYQFEPGQATELSINKPGWEEERRPFTFTSLREDPWIEFTIKGYADHKGVTNELHQLKVDDELILRDVWGAIEYKGPGCFIAGGAGITPFVAIFRRLDVDNRLKGNMLLFSNKTAADIIYESEFRKMLKKKAVFILTRETKKNYPHTTINEEYLTATINNFNQHFYVCGPDKMVAGINEILVKLGAKPDSVVFEK